jgi:hypothetical protein
MNSGVFRWLTMIRNIGFIVFGLVLFLAGCSADGDVSAIRERLRTATPTGSDATNVLKFVIDDFKPKKGVSSYYKYVDELQVGRPLRLDVQRLNFAPPAVPKPADWPRNEDFPPRDIYVYIKTYMSGGTLFADWTFDNNDKLVDVYVGIDNTP